MPINANQLREMITTVLKRLADEAEIPQLYSESAVELLMLTAAQETHCGRYLRQINGPALGIFQIEPASYWDLIKWLKRPHRQKLYIAVDLFMGDQPGPDMELQMAGNLPYQIAVARAFYYRKPGALPDAEDKVALAQYYKKHFNTHLGKATVQDALENYEKYAT